MVITLKMTQFVENSLKNLLIIIHEDKPDGSQKSILTIVELLSKSYNLYLVIPSADNIPTENLHHFKNIFLFKSLYNIYSPKKFVNIHTIFPSYQYIASLIRTHKIDIVYINTISNLYLAVLSVFHNVRFVQHVREDIRGYKKFALQIFMLLFASKCIFNTKVQRKAFRLIKYKSIQIYNSVLIKNRNVFETKQSRFIFYVGQINSRKNLITVVRAMVTTNISLVLKIYGRILDENYYSKIKRFVSDRNLHNKIIFEGEKEDIYSILSSCKIIVSISKIETFNRVIVEAALLGIPVISSKIGVHKELFSLGIKGILVENYCDPQCVASAITKLDNNYEKYLYNKKEIDNLKAFFAPENVAKLYIQKVFKYND